MRRTDDFFSRSPQSPGKPSTRAPGTASPCLPNSPPASAPAASGQRAASWHFQQFQRLNQQSHPQTLLSKSPQDKQAEPQEDKISAMEARLNAAAFELGGDSCSDQGSSGPSCWEDSSQASSSQQPTTANGDGDEEQTTEPGWSSPDESPLPTPLHSPALDARPLKPALRSHGSCGSTSSASSSDMAIDQQPTPKRRHSSYVSFREDAQVCPTWSNVDYER